MERRDNYAIQAGQAKVLFLGYDTPALAEKLHCSLDEDYLYPVMLGEQYRISRCSGDVERQKDGKWISANSFSEVMTLLDLVCDCKENRFPAGRWKSMTSFGLQFHQNLNENQADPFAAMLESREKDFRRAAEALGGEPFDKGDIAYSFDMFDGMRVMLQLWFGDDEFPAQIRWLWDENALMYIKYETMYYSLGILKDRILAAMG